jgi:3-hydroxyisobutyrate dehydrogenase
MASSAAPPPTVAVLGTGVMGAAMARNAARAGLPVRAWNRTPERAAPLAQDGIDVVATAAEAVDGADLILTVLFDAASVEQTIRAAAPGLRVGRTGTSADAANEALASALGADATRDGAATPKGPVWIQLSTVGPEETDRLAALAAELGLRFLDAPVSGTRQPAEAGTLVVLAAGDADAREAARPVLDAIGRRTVELEAVGEATRLKLVVNGFVLAVSAGAAEGVALSRAIGLDPATFLAALEGGPLDSPFLQLKAPMLRDEDYAVAFSTRNARKDAGLIQRLGAEHGTRTAVTDAAATYMDEQIRLQGDENDLIGMVVGVPRADG